jgi:hypothetical protein
MAGEGRQQWIHIQIRLLGARTTSSTTFKKREAPAQRRRLYRVTRYYSTVSATRHTHMQYMHAQRAESSSSRRAGAPSASAHSTHITQHTYRYRAAAAPRPPESRVPVAAIAAFILIS